MRTHHEMPFTICLGGEEIELTALIDFILTPGHPATGPSYASGGEPADPPEIEIQSIELMVPDPNAKVYGKQERPTIAVPCPPWLEFQFSNDGVFQALGDSCAWGADDGPDPDAAYDAMRDERHF